MGRGRCIYLYDNAVNGNVDLLDAVGLEEVVEAPVDIDDLGRVEEGLRQLPPERGLGFLVLRDQVRLSSLCHLVLFKNAPI